MQPINNLPSFSVIFEDAFLMVVDKPPNLVVTPSDTQSTLTLSEILAKDFNIDTQRGGVVHRLDKDTSGIILVAKSQEIFENLQSQFKERTVKKEYTTLVHGFIENEITVDAPIARNPGDREKFIALEPNEYIESARDAKTEVLPISQYSLSEERVQEIFSGFNKIQFRRIYSSGYPQFTLVVCKPLTGRTHQIRVHLKYIDHPIVGDEKYGGRKTARLDKRWCPRQFLHASGISFIHPMTMEILSFQSPLPDDLQQVLSFLTKPCLALARGVLEL